MIEAVTGGCLRGNVRYLCEGDTLPAIDPCLRTGCVRAQKILTPDRGRRCKRGW
jgi:hypothetical protein